MTDTPIPSIEVRLPIKLGQFVKLASLAASGAEARELIEAGDISVNGWVETRRGSALAEGDVIALAQPRGALRVRVTSL
ncbi:RNA-binding S4 domain-containing protein [Actinotignum sanguinis]|uniref:RNA-binding S4 domain-containing protein n=1 Tax=Actinotignum sanguinis TaxID=1445614 RepID=UPI0029343408|nr:RNA-binding S4 domain-containing protein [Actinotignum sanguinis]MDV2437119.1 RNA-binding S4 domain-containing protein [Actinotignum sanguinis]